MWDNDIDPRDNRVHYKYTFSFANQLVKEFDVALDGETLNLILPGQQTYPEWVQLDCFQCSCCPLELKQIKYCPAAVSLVSVVEAFRDSLSYDKVNVVVNSAARTYLKQEMSLQKAVSSLIGLYMASSGCPVLEKLKPMVRCHLPFASAWETAYRVLSMYLLAQYFIYKKGQKPDWDLEKLVKSYEDIQKVNESFSRRLHQAKIKDASLNAVVILDVFANQVLWSVGEKPLTEIGNLFEAYFRD